LDHRKLVLKSFLFILQKYKTLSIISCK